jgi:tetratricopeptide (TPR) repeat protein
LSHTVLAALALLTAPPLEGQRARLLVQLDELERRATVDSNDAPAHYDLALAYWLTKRYDEADKQLRLAIAIEPHTAPAYLALSFLPYARRAKLWEEDEKGKVPAEWQAAVEEAWHFRREAFLLDPMVDLKPLALMIPPASSLGLRGNAEMVYTYLMNGFGSFWDGQYGRAYQFFREISGNATDEDRKRFGSWFLWYEALAAAHTNDFARAETDVRMLLGRAEAQEQQGGGAMLAFSNANHYRYTLACLLDMAGRSRDAVPLLQEALTNDVGLFMAHVRLATMLEDQHRGQAALEERRRAVAANPAVPGARAQPLQHPEGGGREAAAGSQVKTPITGARPPALCEHEIAAARKRLTQLR